MNGNTRLESQLKVYKIMVVPAQPYTDVRHHFERES